MSRKLFYCIVCRNHFRFWSKILFSILSQVTECNIEKVTNRLRSIILKLLPHIKFSVKSANSWSMLQSLLRAQNLTSRKHLRTKVTPDFHLTYSTNGGNLGSGSKY